MKKKVNIIYLLFILFIILFSYITKKQDNIPRPKNFINRPNGSFVLSLLYINIKINITGSAAKKNNIAVDSILSI